MEIPNNGFTKRFAIFCMQQQICAEVIEELGRMGSPYSGTESMTCLFLDWRLVMTGLLV